MTLPRPRKVLWLAVAGTACLVFLLLLLPAKPQRRTLDFRIAGRPQMTNGAMLISFILSNGTSRALNIQEDVAGNPFLLLDDGKGGGPPGAIGRSFVDPANKWKIGLAPGAALTNAVRLTNPPPRFRLLVEVRDLAQDPQIAALAHLRSLVIKARLSKWTRWDARDYGWITLPTSPWIEDGNTSTIAQRTTERLNEIPANGLSQ